MEIIKLKTVCCNTNPSEYIFLSKIKNFFCRFFWSNLLTLLFKKFLKSNKIQTHAKIQELWEYMHRFFQRAPPLHLKRTFTLDFLYTYSFKQVCRIYSLYAKQPFKQGLVSFTE